jgi:hypothetical protein
MMKLMVCILALILSNVHAANPPFFNKIAPKVHILGNDVWNVTVSRVVANKLFYKGVELVGRARGHYASYSMFPFRAMERVLGNTKIRRGQRISIRYHSTINSFAN